MHPIIPAYLRWIQLYKLVVFNGRQGSGQRTGGICYYCHRTFVVGVPYKRHELSPTKDHLIPKSRGGKTNRSNVKLACNGCNQKKGNMTEQEFYAFLRQKGKRREKMMTDRGVGVTIFFFSNVLLSL